MKRKIILLLTLLLLPIVVNAEMCKDATNVASNYLSKAESNLKDIEKCYGYKVSDGEIVKGTKDSLHVSSYCATNLITFENNILLANKKLAAAEETCSKAIDQEIYTRLYEKITNYQLLATKVKSTGLIDYQSDPIEIPNEPTEGQIQVITCGGNSNNKIPNSIPIITRTLYDVIRYIIPVIIIGLGMYDFTTAVVASKESEMDQKKNKFIRRIIAGIAIFFILSLVKFVFGLVGSENKDNFMGCVSCFLSSASDCVNAGYVSQETLDEEDKNKNPTHQPEGSTGNKVVISDKEDTSSNNGSTNVSGNPSVGNDSIVFLGDSRMDGMEELIGGNITYIAKVGAGYYWYRDTAKASLERILKDKPKSKVVLALGYNDVDYTNATFRKNQMNNYVKAYQELIEKYPKTAFYITSIMPVDENKNNDGVTNALIEECNKIFKDAFPNRYLDVYSYLKNKGFSTADGVHYTPGTYKDIQQYIIDNI